MRRANPEIVKYRFHGSKSIKAMANLSESNLNSHRPKKSFIWLKGKGIIYHFIKINSEIRKG